MVNITCIECRINMINGIWYDTIDKTLQDIIYEEGTVGGLCPICILERIKSIEGIIMLIGKEQ